MKDICLVSIIIPVYNVEKYVERCIESVLQQTYTNWELILVDDGSSDNSGFICDQYSALTNVHVVHQPNMGVSRARNTGLKIAAGEYILFVDADDWISQDMLSLMLTEGNNADMIACDVYDVKQNNNGEHIIKQRNIWKDATSPQNQDIYYDIYSRTTTLWNKLLKRDIIGSLRFDESFTYGEDSHFLVRLLKRINNYVIVNKPLYFYCINRPGNVVSSGVNEQTKEFLDNNLEIYYELIKQGRAGCGIAKIVASIFEVFRKIPFNNFLVYRKYIFLCGKTLRRTKIKHRLEYLNDIHFCKSLRAKILFVLIQYLPVCAYVLLYKKHRLGNEAS